MTDQPIEANTSSRRQQRLAALRAELQRRELDGFLIPLADEHQGEYIPPGAQRLAWLTGFTGSAGLAVVLADQAAIFSDGRYTLQLQMQVDTDAFLVQQIPQSTPAAWLRESLSSGQKIGFDPWLHTRSAVETLAKSVTAAGAELVGCDSNPIDAIWEDQPSPPRAPIAVHTLDYAGKDSASKCEEIGASLVNDGIDAAVLTMPDSIAWLLNIRGGDVHRTPLALSFAIIHANGHCDWFVDPEKLSAPVREHLGNRVTTATPDQLGTRLDKLGNDDKRVLVDPSSAAEWVHERLRLASATIVPGDDPCLRPKACKNAVELAGTRAAHQRDGLAVTRFLHWLADNAGDGSVDELGAQQRLFEFRSENKELRDLSFDTISGAGANGAVVHYRVDASSNSSLQPGSLYLVDSGGQYLDGTTDITRTVAIGTPTAEQINRFTLVLKGHIALATARFPVGTSGSQLDTLARLPLWQAGLDFDHGTGHGVGSYLSVHEGPQRISKVPNHVALEPGMIISNEPGYYKTGEFGIRIENLVAVEPATDIATGERPMLSFETLTLAPIDRNLIDTALLTDAEQQWLNNYHQRVLDTLSPALEDPATNEWLKLATRPV